MVESFIASWHLFASSYVSALGLGVTLSLLGVLVVARNQIFLGLAASQAATLGTSVALTVIGAWFGPEYALNHSEVFVPGTAIFASISTVLAGRKRGFEEATNGVVYLLSISLALVLLSRSPLGLEQVERMVRSSIIGATTVDAWVSALAALLAVGAFIALRRDLVLFALDPEFGALIGRGGGWSRLLPSIFLGAVLGFGIHICGVVYIAGTLVLPPLIARAVCREVQQMFIVAPLCFLFVALPALAFAHASDVAPAQMVIAALAVTLILTTGAMRLVKRYFGGEHRKQRGSIARS